MGFVFTNLFVAVGILAFGFGISEKCEIFIPRHWPPTPLPPQRLTTTPVGTHVSSAGTGRCCRRPRLYPGRLPKPEASSEGRWLWWALPASVECRPRVCRRSAAWWGAASSPPFPLLRYDPRARTG